MTKGTEDGQEIMLWVGDALQTWNADLIGAATVPYGPWAVDQWAGAELFVRSAVGGVQLNIDWATDTSFGVFLGSRQWNLLAGDTLQVIERNLGSAFRINVTGSVAGTTISGAVAGSNVSPYPYAAWGTGLLAQVNNSGVGAGNTATAELVTYRGPATVSVDTAAAAYTILVIAKDYTGAEQDRPLSLVSAGAPNVYTVNLSGNHHTLSITNNDAAARRFRVAVAAAG